MKLLRSGQDERLDTQTETKGDNLRLIIGAFWINEKRGCAG
jgi:hypothetical protein